MFNWSDNWGKKNGAKNVLKRSVLRVEWQLGLHRKFVESLDFALNTYVSI